MGNWRTVEIKGNVSINQKDGLITYLTTDENWESPSSKDDIFYLQISKTNSICGLNKWINNDGSIDASGNVFERDSQPEDIKNEMITIAENFDGLNVIVNIGDDYESETCVMSLIVKGGKVEVVEPIVKNLEGIGLNQMEINLLKALKG